MDISLIPVSGVAQFYTSPAATTDTTPAATQFAPATQVPAVAIPQAIVKDAQSADQKQAQAPQAAASVPFNYPLGDKEFSFFKDAEGKTITRYVSERDGTVTYTPQPTLVKPISIEA